MIAQTEHSYKILCLDIDGTLINDDKNISDITQKEILRVVSTYSLTLIFVSARMPVSIDNISGWLGINQPIVAYNGALVLGALKDKRRPIYSSLSLDIEMVCKILAYARQTSVHIGLFRFDEWIVNALDYWARREIRSTKVSPTGFNPEEKLLEWGEDSLGPHKILLREARTKLDFMEDFLKKNFAGKIIYHRNKETVLEIMPIDASKEDAIEMLSRKLHVPETQIVAFGDSYNDIGMLKFAGLGIAMENAPTEVKEAANEVTSSNNEDGIAIGLRKFFP